MGTAGSKIKEAHAAGQAWAIRKQTRGAGAFGNKDRGVETLIYILGLAVVGYQIFLYWNDMGSVKYEKGRKGNKVYKTIDIIGLVLYILAFLTVIGMTVGMWRHVGGADKHRIYISGALILGILALMSITFNTLYLGDPFLEVEHVASSPSSSGGLIPAASVPTFVKASTYANVIFLFVLLWHFWSFKLGHFEGKIASRTPL
jgi:hypothetical protein